MRASLLPYTSVGCIRFAGIDFVEFALENASVLFRVEGNTLSPVVRGDVEFADPHGRFIVVNQFAGDDADDDVVYDYLKAIAPAVPAR